MTRIASNHRRRVKTVIGLLAGGLLLAAPAAAQFELEEGEALPYPGDRDLLRRELSRPTSTIELGAYFLSEDSFKFGQFKGLEDKGWEPLGRIDLGQRALWDSGEVWQWRLQGQNLGLDSRYLRGDYKQQGRFGVWLEYDKIPNFLLENGLTPFGGRGGQTLVLRPGWVPAESADEFTALDATLTRFDVQFEREALRGGFDLILPERWELDVEWEREYRDGERIVGAIIGSTGGNPRTSLVPQPIDLQTTEVDAKVRYNGATGQMELGYYFSDLDNVDDSLTWTNPYNLSAWDPSAAFPPDFATGAGLGRKSTGPDNYFNQVTFAGGLNLPERTRVMLNAAYGVMRQNDQFLPYTINSELFTPTPLPETDLDGEIQTTLINLRVVSKPVDRLRLEAGYRFDDRDNNTPRDVYLYVGGDSVDQGTIDESRARRNRPYSYKLNEAQAEIGYEILPRTEASLGYEYEEIDRTFSEREETREQFYRAGLQSMPSYQLTLRADYEFSTREGSHYEGNASFIDGFSEEHIAAELADLVDEFLDDGLPLAEAEAQAQLFLFENAPGLRKFYLGDRDRNSLRLQATWTPHEDLSVGAVAEWIDEDYDNAELGLQEVRHVNYTLDAAYALCAHATAHVFYTYEDFESDQRGRSFRGSSPDGAFDPTRNWDAEDEDSVDTVGAGLDLDLLNGRLLLGADYAYSKTRGSVGVITGSGLDPALPLPDVEMRLHNASLRAEYRVRPDFSVHFGYLFEWLRSDDWATEDLGVQPGVSQTLLIADEPPQYRAHLFSLSFSYKFW